MYVARMFCTDPGCADELVLEAEEVMQLAAAQCCCGADLEIRGLPDWIAPPRTARVLPLLRRPPLPDELGLAA